MRSLARAVAILCLSTVVSCSEDAPPPTRPEPISPATEGTVSVIVSDIDGRAITTDVFFYLEGSSVTHPEKVVTEASPVEVKLPIGDYIVNINPYSHSGYTTGRVNFRVNEGANRFDYRYAGTRVHGATTFLGADLSGATFQVTSNIDFAQGISSNGHYEFVLPPGIYSVRAFPPYLSEGLPQLERRVTVTEEDMTLDFDFSGYETAVAVTVKGQPVAQAGIVARGTPATGWGTTDETGEETLYLPEGDYSFEVRGVRGVTCPLTVTQAITGPGTIPLNFDGITWNVTLRRASDLTPVSHASVNVLELGSSRRGVELTDDEGRFQMIVPPGVTHEIVAYVPRATPWGPYALGTRSSTEDATFDLLIDLPPDP